MDWPTADRIDPESVEENAEFRCDEMTEGIRKTAEKDALLLNSRRRMDELGEAPTDRLNL